MAFLFPFQIIRPLVCPPPPSDVHISDEMIGKLIAPPPNHHLGGFGAFQTGTSPTSRNLLKDTQLLNSQLMNEAFPGQSQDLSGGQFMDSNFSHNSTAAEIQALLAENQQSSLDYGRGRLGANLPIEALLLGTGSLDQVEPLPAEDEPQSSDLDRAACSISDTERLKKSIGELVDTEKSYVNVSRPLKLTEGRLPTEGSLEKP